MPLFTAIEGVEYLLCFLTTCSVDLRTWLRCISLFLNKAGPTDTPKLRAIEKPFTSPQIKKIVWLAEEIAYLRQTALEVNA